MIEKSPPHIVRIDQLTDAFPNHSLVAFNRNPYANCSSILYRHHDPEAKREADRLRTVSKLAETWLLRSQWIRKWIEERNVTTFTYEEFCADPATYVSKLAANLAPLRTVDVNKSIKVKEYEKQGLMSFNPRQISKLSQDEIDAISRVLSEKAQLVSFFGYDIL